MFLRVVLITGCSTGIGYALAILLAKDPNKSFKVFATVMRQEDGVELKEAAREYLGSTLFVEELDVRYDNSVTVLVEKIIAKEGRIDVLGKTFQKLRIDIILICTITVLPIDSYSFQA